jgi:hypothetical protein
VRVRVADDRAESVQRRVEQLFVLEPML